MPFAFSEALSIGQYRSGKATLSGKFVTNFNQDNLLSQYEIKCTLHLVFYTI